VQILHVCFNGFMKLSELQEKLIAAARSNPPSDRVPHAFEKRITALLAGRPVLDQWAVWSRALWRGAVGCLAVLVLFTTWLLFLPHNGGSAADLSQDFENTMLASADQDTDNSNQ
jgi:hypothetical protein